MATFKSDLLTAADSVSVSDQQAIEGDRIGGMVLYAFASYTLAGTEAADDIIALADIPADCVVLPQLSKVTCGADPGTALVLDIGDSDVDRYADGIALSSGGQVEFTSGTMPVAVATPYRMTAKTRVNAKVITATSLTAAVELTFTIAYRIRG